jgi:O-antigen/teichoic acid export membrane protein
MINKRLITFNLIWLFLGQGASGVMFFAAMAVLARRLGPEAFGVISFSEVVFMFFLTWTNLGIGFIGAREVAKKRERAAEYVGRVLTVRLLLGLACLAVMLLFIFFIPKPIDTKYTAAIYALALIPATFLLDWLFQGLEKMHFISIGVFTRAAIFTIGVVFLIREGTGTQTVAYIFLASWVVSSSVVLFFYVLQGGLPRLRWEPALQKKLIKDSWPIGVGLVVGWVIHYFDSTILFFLKGAGAAGQYNAAYRPIILMATALTVYFNVVFPSMSRFAGTDDRSMRKIVNMSVGGGLALLLPVAVLGVYLAGPVMEAIYGIEYSESGPLFALLLWWPILVLVVTTYTRVLVSYDHQRYIARVSVVTAVCNIGFNLILIPYWGGMGAAAAKIGADLITLFIYHRLVGRVIRVPTLKLTVCPVIAILAMLLFIGLASPINVWAMAVGSSITYLAALFVSSRLIPGWRRLILSGSST